MTRSSLVVWTGIVIIGASLLFPPYGYSKYRVIGEYGMKSFSQPWTYVQHSFVFSDPPVIDKRLNHDGLVGIPEDMAIAWPIVIVQASLVGLVAFGLVFTKRERSGESTPESSLVRSTDQTHLLP